jgi:signal transduction histidine kinase
MRIVTTKGQRDSFTRAIAAGTFVIFALSGALLSYFSYSKAVDDLRYVAEQTAVSHNRLFVNLIWPRYRAFAATAHEVPVEEIAAEPASRMLMSDIRQLAQGTQILKVKVFNTEGLTIFSTEAAQIGSNSYTSPGLQAALRGLVDSRMEKRAKFTALDQVVHDRWVVSSYLPIRNVLTNTIEGILEVYSDISDTYDLVMRHVLTQVLVIIVVLCIAFALVLLVVQRADLEISRRWRENRALSEAMVAAENASLSKSTFLANMSHELRTPLNAIIGFAEMIRLQYFGALGDARYQAYAGHIHDAGQHLLAIINAVLDLSKIEAGKMRVNLELLDPAEVATGTLRLIEHEAEAAGLKLNLKLAADLPQMRLDRAKLRQILLNLLGNAVKFTPSGGSVTLSVEPLPPAFVDFSLRDSGIGMRPEDLTTAMAPFGQVDNLYTRRHDGTGLGLPLSKHLAELMGGSLSITSVVGEGTHIRVLLPVEPKS